ncbi:MAG: T9SS type A sorting domain-containing protein, partial [Bacteroidota bacterium]|nr:T9SS type A sorting domain-containing protein [Bacteroidota bacterium]
SRALINRVDDQTGARIQHTISSSIDRHPLLMQNAPQAAVSFNIVMHKDEISFNPGSVATMTGDITNLTNGTVRIIFNRKHLRIPDGWTSSVCFGTNCFSPATDSIPPMSAFSLDPGITGSFVLNIYCPAENTNIDSLIDYIRFSALSGDPEDTLSFTLKGILTAPSAVHNAQPKSGSHPMITSIYPSPLISGDAIKVKVSSPREGNLSYSIYDGVGRVVALGVTKQHINLGDNTISIGSLDGLANGSYLLKLTFADGSSDTHFFQVVK